MSLKIPIETLSLFPVLDEKLITLLRGLSPSEWDRPTIAKLWTVKDIAAHLLDGNLRTLSLSRDKHVLQADMTINGYGDLVAYLNRLNKDWVTAMKRLSPEVLVSLLELTGKQFFDHLTELDPWEDAIFAVSWAGEQTSKNWFHIAREYTEKYHHQQQIREAVGSDELLTRSLFYPFIDTLMRGMPVTYQLVDAAPGTTIEMVVTTEIGGSWALIRDVDGWKLEKEIKVKPIAQVSITPETAWKLFTKGLSPDQASRLVEISGDAFLGSQALRMVAVMA